jgi:glycosyltransferase involved in cell wall biosynthesis
MTGLRVLFVINGLGTGGAERSLAEMLPGLAERGISPVVGCLNRRSAGVQDDVIAQGFDVRFVDGTGPIARTRRLRSLIRNVRPDLIHTTIFEADIAGRLAALRTGVPVLSSLVNTSYEPVRLADPNVKRWRLEAARRVDAFTARRMTTHFHAISEAVKASAIRRLGVGPERITVVPRGRDPKRLGGPSTRRRDTSRKALGLGPTDRVILNVGRREHQKGQRYLLQATAEVVPAQAGLVTVIAGREGHAADELNQIAEQMRLNGHVRFLGHRDDVPDLLAAADVFVFPSLYEGLGGSLIEAMALGLPIVTSDIPAIREVVEPEGNAVIVPPGDAEALARGIERVLNDPEMARRFGQRSRDLFLERFTLERSVEAMAALYRDVAQIDLQRAAR